MLQTKRLHLALHYGARRSISMVCRAQKAQRISNPRKGSAFSAHVNYGHHQQARQDRHPAGQTTPLPSAPAPRGHRHTATPCQRSGSPAAPKGLPLPQSRLPLPAAACSAAAAAQPACCCRWRQRRPRDLLALPTRRPRRLPQCSWVARPPHSPAVQAAQAAAATTGPAHCSMKELPLLQSRRDTNHNRHHLQPATSNSSSTTMCSTAAVCVHGSWVCARQLGVCMH
jgi:hypothetical protein